MTSEIRQVYENCWHYDLDMTAGSVNIIVETDVEDLNMISIAVCLYWTGYTH